ncbi:hypothetical protein PCK1_000685 [Pneumocystis canis]|nr:hypothetical protein PCK1_000685 [Pneumocystis canis]
MKFLHHLSFSHLLLSFKNGRTKDVTGIIRVSRGSGYYTTQEDDKPDTSNYDESGNSQFEMLYSVHDSGAQIFPKGTF